MPPRTPLLVILIATTHPYLVRAFCTSAVLRSLLLMRLFNRGSHSFSSFRSLILATTDRLLRLVLALRIHTCSTQLRADARPTRCIAVYDYMQVVTGLWARAWNNSCTVHTRLRKIHLHSPSNLALCKPLVCLNITFPYLLAF